MIPAEFIEVGVKLLAGGTEAHHRSAVSRFYYGAFHTAGLLLAEHCKIQIPIHESHAKLPQCLVHADDLNVAEAGRNLDTLRKMRRIADYELEDVNPRSAQWARQQLILTQKIVQTLEAWPASIDFSDSVKSVRAYAKDTLKLRVLDL